MKTVSGSPQARLLFVCGILLLALGTSGSTCHKKKNVSLPPFSDTAPTSTKFRETQDFVGSYDEGATVEHFGGRAIYEGRVVFTNLDRSVVANLLDSRLKLAAPTDPQMTDHPVILMFGHQTKTTMILPGGVQLPVGDDYRELILMIPFVQEKSGTKWHNYVVRIYLDDFWAMVGGNQWYGYRKEEAEFTEQAASPQFQVASGGAARFEASVEDVGPPLTDAQAEAQLPYYPEMKTILGMPILGTLEQYPGDPFVCSYFDFRFKDGVVQAMRSKHTFVSMFVPDMAGFVSAGELASVPDGAWRVSNLPWQLGLAGFCDF